MFYVRNLKSRQEIGGIAHFTWGTTSSEMKGPEA